MSEFVQEMKKEYIDFELKTGKVIVRLKTGEFVGYGGELFETRASINKSTNDYMIDNNLELQTTDLIDDKGWKQND